ncbi:hypothetical protein QTP88_002034 [Uroleucon formosanum]
MNRKKDLKTSNNIIRSNKHLNINLNDLKTSEDASDITGKQCFESTDANSNFNLNYNATATQKIVSRKKMHKTWLSILVEDNDFKSMFYLICKAFGSGIIESYFQASKEMSKGYLINRNMMAVKRQKTENNIHVLKEVFKIIKFLGRQNLPYRGSASNETLSNFDDILINKAWRMVENTTNDIKQISFENIFIKPKQFAIETNDKLTNLKLPEHILVEEKLPEEEPIEFSKIYPSMNGALSQRAEEIRDNMHNENNLVDDVIRLMKTMTQLQMQLWII